MVGRDIDGRRRHRIAAVGGQRQLVVATASQAGSGGRQRKSGGKKREIRRLICRATRGLAREPRAGIVPFSTTPPWERPAVRPAPKAQTARNRSGKRTAGTIRLWREIGLSTQALSTDGAQALRSPDRGAMDMAIHRPFFVWRAGNYATPNNRNCCAVRPGKNGAERRPHARVDTPGAGQG